MQQVIQGGNPIQAPTRYAFLCPSCKVEVCDPNFASYIDNSSKMIAIAAAMRMQNPEAEELERSARKNDNHALQKVEFPDKGGVLTWMDGYELPFEGFPFFEFVDRIDLLKKMSRSLLSGMFHTFREKKFLLIFLLPVIPILPHLLCVAVYTFHRFVERFMLREERYCDAVRELYRCFPKNNLSLQIRDLVCMLFEMDNAYRYRFQNLIIEVDKKAVKKNVIKELLRLTDLASSREKHEDIRNTWKLVRLALRFYVRFDLKLKRIIKNVLLNIDIEKVKMSESAKLFSSKREDYDFTNNV
jgi:hypothetical protein